MGRGLGVGDGPALEIWSEEPRLSVGQTGDVVKHERGGMSLGQIEQASRPEECRDDACPESHVGQPGKRAPGDEDHVEVMRARDRGQRLMNIRPHEVDAFGQEQFPCQRTGGLRGGRGEIQPHHLGRAALRQPQAIGAEMALQVNDPLAPHRRQFRLVDGIEAAVPLPQAGQVIATGREIDADPLIPVRSVDAAPIGFGHGGCPGGSPPRCLKAWRTDRVFPCRAAAP